jgi:hypothetical protein
MQLSAELKRIEAGSRSRRERMLSSWSTTARPSTARLAMSRNLVS